MNLVISRCGVEKRGGQGPWCSWRQKAERDTGVGGGDQPSSIRGGWGPGEGAGYKPESLLKRLHRQ